MNATKSPFQDHLELENRFLRILQSLQRLRLDGAWVRPFGLEIWGTPKAYKTTVQVAASQFLKRIGWKVTYRPEGAEVIDRVSRKTPHYNLQTARYALSEITDRLEGDLDIVISDRGLMDSIAWLEYWARKGKLSVADRDALEAANRTEILRSLYDLHVCMVCDAHVALEREATHSLTDKPGETMNRATLEMLNDIHRAVWERLDGENDRRMVWHDTSRSTPKDVLRAVLSDLASAFEHRLSTIK